MAWTDRTNGDFVVVDLTELRHVWNANGGRTSRDVHLTRVFRDQYPTGMLRKTNGLNCYHFTTAGMAKYFARVTMESTGDSNTDDNQTIMVDEFS